jgi:hypothetical protein
LVGVEASGASAPREKYPMYTLFSLMIPFVLLHHGFNSIVLRIITEIKSGLKYCREASKK